MEVGRIAYVTTQTSRTTPRPKMALTGYPSRADPSMTGASRSSLPTASKARNRIARPLMMRPAQSPFREAAAVPVSVARGARAGSIDFPLSIPSMRAVSLSGRKPGFRAVSTDSEPPSLQGDERGCARSTRAELLFLLAVKSSLLQGFVRVAVLDGLAERRLKPAQYIRCPGLHWGKLTGAGRVRLANSACPPGRRTRVRPGRTSAPLRQALLLAASGPRRPSRPVLGREGRLRLKRDVVAGEALDCRPCRRR